MSAAPGWYDAGTPGRLRWWDGTAWTQHEVDAPATPAPTAGTPSASAAAVTRASAAAPAPATPVAAPAPARASAPSGGQGPEPGWYPTRSGLVRWWDGRVWTGARVRDGRPGVDWATSEQPTAAWAFGLVFLSLGVSQALLGTIAPGVAVSALPTVFLGLLWLAIGIQSSAVRRLPRPVGPPETGDLIRPLPGEVEPESAPGALHPQNAYAPAAPAGWYPVAARTTRWWTGSRWSQYVGTTFGIRPTFHGPRSYRTIRTMVWVLLALGVVLLPISIVVLSLSSASVDPFLPVFGVVLLMAGLLVLLVGVVFLAFLPRQRRILLLPDAAPAPPPTPAPTPSR